MNLYNVLSNRYVGMSNFERLFAQKFGGTGGKIKELEGVPPLTILSAGEDLINYHIYGNTENGESVGERTENLFDKDKASLNTTIDSNTGKKAYSAFRFVSDYIPVLPGDTLTITGGQSGTCYFWTFDNQKEYITYYDNQTTLQVDTAGFIRFSTYMTTINGVMLTEGSTAPTSYIPYGYKLTMTVNNGITNIVPPISYDVPIYIGSDPLAEDEYVDFGEQKVYRMEGGTLTPTDPPVPIPALPTIEGETIIDYNPSGTPAVEPSNVYIKYKVR